MSSKKLIFLQLNEMNFDILKKYDLSKLKNFKKLLTNIKTTTSEEKYELLEPWIQWVSAFTGKSASEHKIFRLGDIIDSNFEQIFENVENKGFKVGALLPMNAANRLKNPAYFLPDPWTQTSPDNSMWSNMMREVFSQAINDNSRKKITLINYLKLLLIFIKFFRFKNINKYIFLFLFSIKYSYKRVLFLDLLIHDIHMKLLKKFNTNFSSVFFNGGAHIQHHYFYNSKIINNLKSNPSWYIKKDKDPLFEILKLYDSILEDYLNLDYEIIISTGLTQIPSDNPVFYYRIKNHKLFLKKLNIKYKNVFPRMTRDFLVEFENEEELLKAKNILENIVTEDNHKIFDEIDRREKSLFITLGYSKEINSKLKIFSNNEIINLKDWVSFVALKNGIHSQKGFVYFSENLKNFFTPDKVHVKYIYNSIKDFFGNEI